MTDLADRESMQCRHSAGKTLVAPECLRERFQDGGPCEHELHSSSNASTCARCISNRAWLQIPFISPPAICNAGTEMEQQGLDYSHSMAAGGPVGRWLWQLIAGTSLKMLRTSDDVRSHAGPAYMPVWF